MKKLSAHEIRMVKLREIWGDYLSAAHCYAMKETKSDWPEKTILIVCEGTELAEILENSVDESFLGYEMMIIGNPGISWDFFVACEWSPKISRLQKSFYEYIQTNNVKKIEDAFNE